MHGTALNDDVLAVSVFFMHGACGLDHNGVVARFDDAAADHHIFAAVRINAVIIRPAVVVQDADAVHHHVPAACHVQGPESGVIKGDIPHGQIFHILQVSGTGPEALHEQRALMKAVIHVAVVKYLPSSAVNLSISGNDDVLFMTGKQEASAVHTVHALAFKFAGEVDHILLLQRGNELRSIFQMKLHVGTQADAAGQIFSRRNDYPSARFAAGIHRCLNRLRTFLYAVSHGAIIQNVVIHVLSFLSVSCLFSFTGAPSVPRRPPPFFSHRSLPR